MDSPTDTHRHLSHLIGVSRLGPSYHVTQKISSYTQVMLSQHMTQPYKVAYLLTGHS